MAKKTGRKDQISAASLHQELRRPWLVPVLAVFYFLITCLMKHGANKGITLLLLAAAVVCVVVKTAQLGRRMSWPALLLGLYICMDGISTLYAPSGKFALYEFLKVAGAACLALLLTALEPERPGRTGRCAATVLETAGALVSLVSIDTVSTQLLYKLMVSFTAQFGASMQLNTLLQEQRLKTIFENPNVFAGAAGAAILLSLGLAAGVALTVVGVILTPQILRWMGTPDNVLVNSIAYFRMYFMGSIAVVMYNVGASILQSVGDSRSPMQYLIAASIINIVLDLVLIGGFRMGVGAAAFATIASQTVSAVLAFSKLIRSKEEWAVRPREVCFDGPSLKAVIVQGLPSGIQNSVISLANVIVQSNINSFGANAMAGCGAYSKVEGFAFLPVTCFAMALATFVSQNVGAGQPDRVRKGMKFGILCSIAMAEVVGVCIYLASPWLIGAFSSEPDVIAFGVQQAHTAALFYCLLAFSHCCAGILRGLGRPVVPMMVMLAVWCVLRITYITITLHFIHAIGVVFWAYPLTWSISSLLFAWYIRHCPIPQLGGGAPH